MSQNMNAENSLSSDVSGDHAIGTITTTASTASTPGPSQGAVDKSEKKREASSPLYPDTHPLHEKKIRHYTGDNHQLPEGTGDDYLLPDGQFETPIDMDMDGEDVEDNGVTPVHILPQPINPNDIVQIASSLRALMLPEIKLVIRESMKEVTKSLKDGIDKLHKDVDDLRNENEELRKTNSELETRLSVVEYESDNLEQYSRRNSLRISGIPEEPDENTDQRVIQLAGGLGIDISPNDIDRSHRVGKLELDRGRTGRGPLKMKRRTRDILVKFARYNTRAMLYNERKDLRNLETHKNVYINEDLTKKRSKLLYDARILARAEIVKAAYSTDGKLYIRDHGDTRHTIKSDSDIERFGNVDEAKKMIDRMRLLRLTSQFTSSTVADGASGGSIL